jgi:hypothetical protein
VYKTEVVSLPFTSTSFVDHPVIATESGDLLVSMTYDVEGAICRTRLRFQKQQAFRNRSEAFCGSWHIRDVFDCVCEVSGSDWLEELRVALRSGYSFSGKIRHYMVYIEDIGCLEVAAQNVVIDES